MEPLVIEFDDLFGAWLVRDHLKDNAVPWRAAISG